MRLYRLLVGAAASQTVLCNQTTSRRLTGTSCHKMCVLTVGRTPKMCFKVCRCCWLKETRKAAEAAGKV